MQEKLTTFIKAISDPTRLKILECLSDECCVGDVLDKLEIRQNLISHHLKVLRDAKLVKFKKEGLRVNYCLDKKNLDAGLKLLNKFFNKK
jgi:DNA-binding transcriptional ArsR family regulator